MPYLNKKIPLVSGKAPNYANFNVWESHTIEICCSYLKTADTFEEGFLKEYMICKSNILDKLCSE